MIRILAAAALVTGAAAVVPSAWILQSSPTTERLRGVSATSDTVAWASGNKGTVVRTVDARALLKDVADAAWQCADPGVQYDTTINAWHTCPNTGRINASNPCSEYMHIDDSACNLASLNLMKFRRADGELDVEALEHAVDVVFLAQEILVGYSSYPTPEIERNARAFRQLGLGYANLGALLMARGSRTTPTRGAPTSPPSPRS